MYRPARPALLLVTMGAIVLSACDVARQPTASEDGAAASGETCTRCHGEPGRNAAPPRSVRGETATSDVGVGAHQAHLNAGPFRQAISCSECHVVPSRVEDPGHIENASAPVTFGPLARTGGLQPSWDRISASCNSVYCHGATLPGGSLPNQQPKWTRVDGSQAACGTCHGLPPPRSSGHPTVTGGVSACSRCHPDTVKADGTIDIAGGKHIDGLVEVGGTACTSCHGDASRATAAIAPAPPQDTTGNTSTTALGVGAHQAHLNAGPLRAAVACNECHVVPSDTSHSTGSGPPPVTFGALATSGGATPSWDRNAATCATYCHGSTLPGGSNTAPQWTKVDGTQAACGSCHGIPPPASSGHPAVSGNTTVCAGCHPGTVKADGTIDVAGGMHINGTVDVSGGGCTACHGDSTRAAAIAPAPPRDTRGNTATTALGVGAHQTHLNAGPLRGAIACSECHVVPSDTTHSAATTPPPVTFGSLAKTNYPAASWDRNAATCATYCHGATLSGGLNTKPVWTQVNGTQASCGSCHGLPPSTGQHGPRNSHHRDVSCGTCHGAGYSPTTVNALTHVNGTKEVSAPGWDPASRSCANSCHDGERHSW